MKMLLLSSFIIFLMVNCQSTQEISPEMAKLDGKWKLSKVSYGFPPPNGPTEYKPTYEEILEFNSSKNSFTRTKDGKIIENSTIKLSGGISTRESLIFEKDNTYSFYSFTENPIYLVLYQAVPIGVVLADGNSFYYEKVK